MHAAAWYHGTLGQKFTKFQGISVDWPDP